MGYWNPSRQPPIILPTTRQQVSLTYGVGAWGDWAQVQASTPQDTVLAQIVMTKLATASAAWWVQIGVGVATYEVPIAVVSNQAFIAGSGASPYFLAAYRLPPIFVPAADIRTCRRPAGPARLDYGG